MVQTIALSTPRPITCLLPDILAAWPYKRILHPDYGTVSVESTDWVNHYDFFSERVRKSVEKSLFSQWYHHRSLYPEVHYVTSGLLGCLVFPRTTRGIRRILFYIHISDGSKISVVRVVILRTSISSSTSTLTPLGLKQPPGFATSWWTSWTIHPKSANQMIR